MLRYNMYLGCEHDYLQQHFKVHEVLSIFLLNKQCLAILVIAVRWQISVDVCESKCNANFPEVQVLTPKHSFSMPQINQVITWC